MVFFKKLWAYSLLYKSKVIPVLLGLFFACAFFLYTMYDEKNEKAVVNQFYEVVENGTLFDYKGGKLDMVEAMVVVNPETFSFRDVLIKNKNEDKAIVFKNISRDQFSLYSSSVLEKHIQDNAKFKLFYSINYEPVGAYLGLKDPKTFTNPESENKTTFMDVLRSLLPMLLMIGFLVYFMGRNTTTSSDEVLPANINVFGQ